MDALVHYGNPKILNPNRNTVNHVELKILDLFIKNDIRSLIR